MGKIRRSTGRSAGLEWSILFLFAAVAVLSLSFAVPVIKEEPQENPNTLAIGKLAKFKGNREIGLNSPVQLNWKSKQEVLQLRTQYVVQHPELLANGIYKPFGRIFDQIEDGRPWWGIDGEFYYGPGKDSIKGQAEESRFIANPFLLVAADFPSLRDYFDKTKFTDQSLHSAGFPLVCLPTRLEWNPAARTMDVSYPLSDFTRKLFEVNHWRYVPSISNKCFGWVGVIAYNARDFNLNYIYVDPVESRAIIAPGTAPVAIPQFIHRGGTCHYPGGCNNMSPSFNDLDNLRLLELPATVKVRLWQNKPKAASDQPDMTCTIHLQ